MRLLCDPALLATTGAPGRRRKADALGRASPSPITVLLKDSMLSRASSAVLAQVECGLFLRGARDSRFCSKGRPVQQTAVAAQRLSRGSSRRKPTKSSSAALTWVIASSRTGAVDRLRQAFSTYLAYHHQKNLPAGSLGVLGKIDDSFLLSVKMISSSLWRNR